MEGDVRLQCIFALEGIFFRERNNGVPSKTMAPDSPGFKRTVDFWNRCRRCTGHADRPRPVGMGLHEQPNFLRHVVPYHATRI